MLSYSFVLLHSLFSYRYSKNTTYSFHSFLLTNYPSSFLFRYHEMHPRNKTHVAWSSCTWFIFNLNTESHYLQVMYYSIYTSDNICLNPTPCYPSYFTYLDNQLYCSWRKYPSPLVPGLLTTALPLLLLPPFHTPQIKLQYLDRRQQQYQPSLSDTLPIWRVSHRDDLLNREGIRAILVAPFDFSSIWLEFFLKGSLSKKG